MSVQSQGLKPSKSSHSFSMQHGNSAQDPSRHHITLNKKPLGDDDSVHDYTSVNEDWNSVESSNVYLYSQQQYNPQQQYSFQQNSHHKLRGPLEEISSNSALEDRQLSFGNPKPEEITVDFRISAYHPQQPSNQLQRLQGKSTDNSEQQYHQKQHSYQPSEASIVRANYGSHSSTQMPSTSSHEQSNFRFGVANTANTRSGKTVDYLNEPRNNLSDVSAIYANALNSTQMDYTHLGSLQSQTQAMSKMKRNSSVGSIGKLDSVMSMTSKPSEILKQLQKNQSQMNNTSSATNVSKEHQLEYAKKLYDQDEVYKNKKQRLAEEVVKQQMDACTFTPKINENGGKRTSTQFQEMQTQFLQYVEEKRQMVRDHVEEQRMSEVCDRPKILAKSKLIMEQKRIPDQQPAYARLYSLHQKDGQQQQTTDMSELNTSHAKYYVTKDISMEARRLQEIESKENTFHPQIHRRSKSLVRNEKVDDILYKDAQRRLTKQQQETKNRSSSKHTPINQSNKLSIERELLLVSKFSKEFQAVLQSLNLPDSNRLQLTDLFEILSRLGFIKPQQTFGFESSQLESEHRLVLLIWQLIGGERFSFIPTQNLVIFLQCVLGLIMHKNSSPRDDSSKDHSFDANERPSHHVQVLLNATMPEQPQTQLQQIQEANSTEFRSINIGCFENTYNTWIVGVEDKKVIRQAFEVLYRNRLASEELRNNKHDWEYSFQPFVSHSSSMLANQHREKMLNQAAKLLDAQEIKMKLPEDGKITHQQLLVLSKLTQETQTLKKKEALQKEEMKECSFHPRIGNLHSRAQSGGGGGGVVSSQFSQLQINDIDGQQQQQDEYSGFTKNQSKERGFKKTEELYTKTTACKSKERRDRTRDEIDFEKMADECTFHPDIHKGRKFYKQDRVMAKDIDKSIDRMRAAQREKEIVNLALSRGYTQSSKTLTASSSKSQRTLNATVVSSQPTTTLRDSPNGNQFKQKPPPIPAVATNVKKQTTQSSGIPITQLLEIIPALKYNDTMQTSYEQNNKNQLGLSSSAQQSSAAVNSSNFNEIVHTQPQGMNEIHPMSQYYYSSSSSDQTYTPSPQDQVSSDSIYQVQTSNPHTTQQTATTTIQGTYALQDVTIPRSNQLPANTIAANISPNLAADEQPDEGNEVWRPEEKIPLLFVDVNLGLGRTERIVVFEGDRSEDLANKFASIHNLDSITRQKFKELLDSQIAGLLSRIDEEEMMSFESESHNQSGQQQQQQQHHHHHHYLRNQLNTSGPSGRDSQHNSERMQVGQLSQNRNSIPSLRPSMDQQYQ